MYSGPGSGSLLAAAGSWDSLCAEVDTTAQVYESMLRGLIRLPWRGPAAEAMAATVAPYIGWLRTTAELAMQTATQARAAAAAFELAYAMTVPPAAVAANRVHLAASTIATNFFGQNTAAIAAAEAQYAEFWAQDTTAMYGYAASSAAARQLAPFSSPPQTTNPDWGDRSTHRRRPVRQQFSLKNLVPKRFWCFSDGAVEPDCRCRLHLPGRRPGFLRLKWTTWRRSWTFPIDIIGAGNNLGTLPVPATVAATDVAPLTAAPRAHRCRGSEQCDRSSWPRPTDRLDVGAGELDSTIEQPRHDIVEYQLPRAHRQPRDGRLRVEHAGHRWDATCLARHARRPSIRRTAQDDGTSPVCRMTEASPRAVRAVRISSCPDSSPSTPPGGVDPSLATGRR